MTPPTALEIYEALLAVASRQVATTGRGQALSAAYPQLLGELLQAIAGNAAMVVRELIDAEIDRAQPEDDDVRPTARDRYESACDDKRREQYDERHIESLRAERS